MRIWPDHVRVNKSGAMSRAAVFRSPLKRRKTGHRIGAIHFFKMEVRKTRDQTRDATSGGLHFYRNGDGVTVILHTENYGQLVQGGGIHRFPEFAFAAGPVPE